MLKLWYNFIRLLYYPIFVWILPLFNKKISDRIQFEIKNTDSVNHSFKQAGIIADFAFEISSEGELEQVKVVIEKLLLHKSRVELIYCSESVEGQCLRLAALYPEHLRLLRLPVLTYLPFGKTFVENWLTAKTLFLCRYDFFPELIFYGRQKEINFILLSGTMKNFEKKITNPFAKWYFNFVYNSFNKVVMATALDRELLSRQFSISDENIETYDFRPIQIYKRIRCKDEFLQKNFPGFDHYKRFVKGHEKRKRIIFGSYWNDESIITEKMRSLLDEKYHLAVVPHNLSEHNIENIKESFNRICPSMEIFEINSSMSSGQVEDICKKAQQNEGVFILNLKGVLCELYSYFGHAYVAGGFRYSVHSLMEPYLSECMIYSGPKIHRSTEYDLIMQNNPDRISVLENESKILPQISSTDISTLSSMSSFKSHYEGHYMPLLIWLGISGNWESSDAR